MLLEKPPARINRGSVLIDGDIVVYRAALAPTSITQEDARQKVDEVIDWIVQNACNSSYLDDFQVYLSGSSNFRHDIAVTHPYKGNRKDLEPPVHKQFCRDYLKDNYNAIVSDGEEADDLLAIEATRLGYSTVIASIDKDLLQVPCYHYNFKNDTWFEVTDFEGLLSFYLQILTGDKADNIIGLHGVGPVKAKKLLAGLDYEQELWDKVVEAYDGDEERVLENARLLWLRREENEMWLPPHLRDVPVQSKQDTDQA